MVVMTIELRDVIAALSVIVALASMIIVSRNARRATTVNAQNMDLTRIRDLRQELKETKDELDRAKAQATQLTIQLQEANEAAMTAYRQRAEMLRFAQMPGMDMSTWLSRFAPPVALSDREQ
jgi:septal ring factor EnvC (AmiA/AmiB activator)